MTPLASAISRALIHFAWQGAIVGLSLWVVLAALRRQSAQLRYIVACAGLVLLFVLPLATTVGIYSRPAASNLLSTANAVSQASPAASKLPIAAAAGWLNWLQRWALPLWSLGVVIFSARLMLGWRHAFLLRRRGEAPSSSVIGVVTRLTRLMRVDRPVRVLISSMSDSPSVVGWLRPVILLPAAT